MNLFLIAHVAGRPVAIAGAQVDSVVDLGDIIAVPGAERAVRGLAALRSRVEKVPKPTRRTSSPRFKASPITSKTLSTARDASPLLSPVVSATLPISSCLFICPETPVTDDSRLAPMPD